MGYPIEDVRSPMVLVLGDSGQGCRWPSRGEAPVTTGRQRDEPRRRFYVHVADHEGGGCLGGLLEETQFETDPRSEDLLEVALSRVRRGVLVVGRTDDVPLDLRGADVRTAVPVIYHFATCRQTSKPNTCKSERNLFIYDQEIICFTLNY